MVVASGREHLDDRITEPYDGHVKCPAPKVIHQHRLGLPVVEPVGHRSRCRLVDDALDIEPGDPPGILGRLPLGIIKIRRHRDHRIRHTLSEIVLRVLLQLGQDHRGDRLGCECRPVDPDGPVRAHLPLDGGDGPVRVHRGLALCNLSDQTLPVF